MTAVVPLRQSIEVEPTAASASRGRRFLRQVLSEWRVPTETADQAVLVAGELLVNAILHAATPLSLDVTYAAPIVRVAVRDYSPTPPSRRAYRPDSMTGRGLNVVDTVSLAWGVEPYPDGKVVWANVDGGIRPPLHREPIGDGLSRTDGPERVILTEIPIEPFLAMQQHHDAIVREVEMAGADPEADPLVQLGRHVGPSRSLLHQSARAARRQGKPTSDLVVSLRRGAIQQLREWFLAMEAAESLPRHGRLLTQPAPDEVVKVRQQVLDQLDLHLVTDPPAAPSSTLDDAETAEALGLAFEFAPVGMAVTDLHGRLLMVNRHLCQLLGRVEDELVRHWVADILLPDVPDSPETDGPVRRVRRLVRRDGSVLPAVSTSWVIPAGGGRPARRMYQIQERAEPGAEVAGTPPAGDTDTAPRLAMQLARLQSATARLSRVRSMIEVATVILDETTDSIGADRAALWAIGLEGRTLELLGSRNYPEAMLTGRRHLRLSDRSPATEALRNRQPVLLPSPEFPELGEFPDTATSFTVPLYIESRPIGILSFAWRQLPTLADVDRRFILALGDQCALALDRARLFEGEKRAIQRQEFLAEASRVLAESLDFSATAAQIARLPVPELADSCSVMVMDETDRLHAIAHSHVDPERLRILNDLNNRPEALPPAYLGRVAVTGEPLMTSTVTPDDIDAITADPELRAQVRALDIRSSMTVPLRARGNTVGLLGLQMSDSGRHFGHGDLQLVLDLADRAAIALDNARTFQLRDQVADTLQQSLRPPQLPRLPGAQVAARYQPGSSGVDVGGDFYDVFDDEGDWAVVLGDVCGKGAAAAAITSMVRYSLRALAIQGHQPAVILGRLNEAMERQSKDEERFCTVAYARLVPTARGLRATVCSAGHPLPMVLRANGRVSRVGAAGGLIGLFPEVRLLEETTELLSGDALVLYTDGVTEAHQGNEEFGEERLAQVLAAHAGADAEEIATAIEQAVDQFATPSRRDDLAVLVLRVD